MSESLTSKQCAHVPLFAAGAGQIAREVTPCPRCEIDRLRRFAWWVECGDFENTTDLQRRAHEVLGGSPVETKACLTDAQCDEVIDQLQEIEWSGITRDDVRTWDGMIAEARCSSPVEPSPDLPASTADQASAPRAGSAVVGGGPVAPVEPTPKHQRLNRSPVNNNMENTDGSPPDRRD